jgi:hypothetical protein
MGIVVNTKGVELNEAKFIDKEGKFLFKIEKIEEDGVTQEGALKFKMSYKGVEVGKKEPVYMHSETFNLQQNSLWRIKQLEVALKAPEIYDLDSFVGRYVIADVKARSYVKDGASKTAYNVKEWEYSTLNDKMPPIAEAVENTNDVDAAPVIEIDQDEIPF